MAISKAFAVRAANDASGTILTSGTFNSTGFTHLVVFTKHEGTTTTITPSDNKNSVGWASLTKVDNANSDLTTQLHWAKIGSPGTSHTVTMTLSAARAFRRLGVWLMNADSGQAGLVVEATNQGSTGTAIDAGSLATGSVSTVSFMGVGEYNVSTYTPGTGWTQDWDIQEEDGLGVSSFGQSRADSSGTLDPVCTQSTSNAWNANAASFTEIIGGDAKRQSRLARKRFRSTPRAYVIAAAGQTGFPGLPLETDTAFAIVALKAKALGLNTETDSVLALVRNKTALLGLNIETDSAFGMGRNKLRQLGLNAEIDEALRVLSPQIVLVGLNTETDTVLALSRLKTKAVGLPEETDLAQTIARLKLRAAGLLTEVDTALALVRNKVRQLGLNIETATALAVSRSKRWLVGLNTETDIALPLEPTAPAVGGVVRRARRWLRRMFITPEGR